MPSAHDTPDRCSIDWLVFLCNGLGVVYPSSEHVVSRGVFSPWLIACLLIIAFSKFGGLYSC